MLKIEDIYKASKRIKKFVRETPTIRDEYLSDLTSKEVFLKLENLQVTHAFKIRGSANVIPLLSTKQKKQGLITASTGNHGLGFSYVSGKLGVNSIVVVPINAPRTKVKHIKQNGSKVIYYGESYYEASEFAHAIAKKQNRHYVHSFDNEAFFAGVGTIFLELIDKIPNLDVVIAPIGGGGLLAGISFAAKTINPKIKVFGVQAKGAPSMYQSIKNGSPITLKMVDTLADGVAVKQPSELSFSYVQKFVDGILLVSDNDIKNAITVLHNNSKLIVEGAGAVSTAALIRYQNKIKGKKVALIITGGNIDTDFLIRLLQEKEVT